MPAATPASRRNRFCARPLNAADNAGRLQHSQVPHADLAEDRVVVLKALRTGVVACFGAGSGCGRCPEAPPSSRLLASSKRAALAGVMPGVDGITTLAPVAAVCPPPMHAVRATPETRAGIGRSKKRTRHVLRLARPANKCLGEPCPRGAEELLRGSLAVVDGRWQRKWPQLKCTVPSQVPVTVPALASKVSVSVPVP
jgi:hypothetical protein